MDVVTYLRNVIHSEILALRIGLHSVKLKLIFLEALFWVERAIVKDEKRKCGQAALMLCKVPVCMSFSYHGLVK